MASHSVFKSDADYRKYRFDQWKTELKKILGRKVWHRIPGDNDLYIPYEQGQAPAAFARVLLDRWAEVPHGKVKT